MHVFDPAVPPQNNPRVPSQLGIVPPHAEPDCSTDGWHVPGVEVAATLPTQLSPLPQGLPASQDAFNIPSFWHSMVEFTQDWPWPQAEDTHDAPGAGHAAQVPHEAVAVPPQ